MKRTIVALSSLLAYGLAYGNDSSLMPSATTEENIIWNDTPISIPANSTDQISFAKKDTSLGNMAGAVTYKIAETGQDYSFTVKVDVITDTATCEITHKQVGDENYTVWYVLVK